MDDKTTHIVNEMFWFTATIIGINAFIIQEKEFLIKSISLKNLYGVSTFMTFYAIYLIIHRSAAHANKLEPPISLEGIEEKDKTFVHKLKETISNVLVVLEHIPFVVAEFSGALFFVLLILLSYFGVLYIKTN